MIALWHYVRNPRAFDGLECPLPNCRGFSDSDLALALQSSIVRHRNIAYETTIRPTDNEVCLINKASNV